MHATVGGAVPFLPPVFLKGPASPAGQLCVRQTSGAPSGLTGSPSSPTARPTARPAGGDTEAQTGKGPSEVGAGPRFPEEAREPGSRVAGLLRVVRNRHRERTGKEIWGDTKGVGVSERQRCADRQRRWGGLEQRLDPRWRSQPGRVRGSPGPSSSDAHTGTCRPDPNPPGHSCRGLAPAPIPAPGLISTR